MGGPTRPGPSFLERRTDISSELARRMLASVVTIAAARHDRGPAVGPLLAQSRIVHTMRTLLTATARAPTAETIS